MISVEWFFFSPRTSFWGKVEGFPKKNSTNQNRMTVLFFPWNSTGHHFSLANPFDGPRVFLSQGSAARIGRYDATLPPAISGPLEQLQRPGMAWGELDAFVWVGGNWGPLMGVPVGSPQLTSRVCGLFGSDHSSGKLKNNIELWAIVKRVKLPKKVHQTSLARVRFRGWLQR